MRDVFRVQVAVPALRARLSGEQGRHLSHGDVFAWLLDHGFRLGRGTWLAPVGTLHLLKASEVVRARRMP